MKAMKKLAGASCAHFLFFSYRVGAWGLGVPRVGGGLGGTGGDVCLIRFGVIGLTSLVPS